MKKDSLLIRIAYFATLLAFCVVLLGAYTRLKDAGLGCPDWPGCYGHVTVPKGDVAKMASASFGNQPVEPTKAWAEMTHRYIAGTLGLLIFFITARVIWTRKTYHSPLGLPIFLTLLVLLQASLGRWTVTLKLLPPVVMFHLLGGMTLVALLALLSLRLNHAFREVNSNDRKKFFGWALFGLILIIGQIFLGGWTSANYASLACTSFPGCSGYTFIPSLDYSHAFSLIDKIGPNYQGGLLDQATKITIHFTHRLGGVIVFFYWITLCIVIFAKAQSKNLLTLALLILTILCIQVALGIMNILLLLPLHVAVSHNAGAAILLISIVTLNYALYPKKS